MRCLYNGIHPCGKCPACLANRQRAFCFRLDQEKKKASFYFWLTLQYDDDHVPTMFAVSPFKPNRDDVKQWSNVHDALPEEEYMCFSKEHCRSFFEKLRKRYAEKGITFKHFLVSEYGPNCTKRPHYHCLLLVYCDHPLEHKLLMRCEMKDFIFHKAWPYGYVTEKSFHGRVISYLTKYCTKPELIGDYHPMKPFTLISRGIGLSYLDELSPERKQYMFDTLDLTVLYGSSRIQLPRYYVDRLIPHSKALLDEAILSGDLELQKRIEEVRERFASKQSKLAQKQSNLYYQNVESIDDIRRRLNLDRQNIGYSWSEFKQKCNKRKDL